VRRTCRLRALRSGAPRRSEAKAGRSALLQIDAGDARGAAALEGFEHEDELRAGELIRTDFAVAERTSLGDARQQGAARREVTERGGGTVADSNLLPFCERQFRHRYR